MQTKTIYAWLLRNYDLEFADASAKVTPDFTTMVVGPVPPVQVRYTRRAQ